MLLLIVGLFVVFVAVVALISRRHAMGLLLFILFSHGIFVFFLGVETAQHLPLFASICVFAILLLKGKYVLPSFIAVWLFMLFLSIMVLSTTVTGGGTDHSLLKLVFYLKPICLAFIVAGLIRTLKDIDVVASYIIAGAFLGSMFNLYQKIFGTYLNKNIWDSSLSRAAGLRGDPNDTAMLLVMSLPVFYYKILDAKSSKQRYFLIMAVLLTLIGIILTGSRAGFLATFVIAMLVLLHNYKKLNPTFFSFPKPKKIALMILLCIVAASFAPSYYWERINTLKSGKEVGQSKSLYSRTILLERGLQVWMENPLLGVGLGNFGQAFIQGGGKKQLYRGPSKDAVAHNMYLELLVETGLIGFLLFLLISLVSLVGFFRIDSSRYNGDSYKSMGYGFTVSLLSMLLFGLTLSQGYNSILWYLLGMGMAAIRINKINDYSAKFLLTDNPMI